MTSAGRGELRGEGEGDPRYAMLDSKRSMHDEHASSMDGKGRLLKLAMHKERGMLADHITVGYTPSIQDEEWVNCIYLFSMRWLSMISMFQPHFGDL